MCGLNKEEYGSERETTLYPVKDDTVCRIIMTFVCPLKLEKGNFLILIVNYPPRFVDIREVDGDSTKPGIDDEGVLRIEVGRTYKYSIETEDPNNEDTVIISLVEGPPGANIDEGLHLLCVLYQLSSFDFLF